MTSTASFTFAGLFLALAFGVPVPEDVTMCSAGLLVAAGILPAPAVFLVSWSAIVFGDTVLFWVGRFWGNWVCSQKWFCAAVTAERRARIEARFQRWGPWACFGVRFVPGLRTTGYILAGASRVTPLGFLGLDCLAASVSVLFWLFGTRHMPASTRVISLWLTDPRWGVSIAASVIVVWFIWWRMKQKGPRDRQINGSMDPLGVEPENHECRESRKGLIHSSHDTFIAMRRVEAFPRKI